MSKILLISLFFLSLFSCGQLVRTPASLKEKKHVVFDIDWTITSEVNPEFIGTRIIEVEGKKYFVHDAIEQFVEELLQKKGMTISFFSGGSSSRNHSLLRQIKLSDGRSLEDIAYKILNREDLTIVESALPSNKFSLRFKKDLKKITTDLSNLVMIEDTLHFVLNQNQEEHVLFIGKTFQHFEKFSDAKHSTGEYIPRSEGEWSLARKKLLVLNSAFNAAYTETEQSGMSWSEAIKIQEAQLDFSSGEWNDYSRMMYKNSQSFKPIESTTCSRIFSEFIQINK
ncbi:MAG: hypothetical protein H7281_08790 [Bacteriovorax sp.]|nr:hypothetical protein [Bacteriovorax sp.]